VGPQKPAMRCHPRLVFHTYAHARAFAKGKSTKDKRTPFDCPHATILYAWCASRSHAYILLYHPFMFHMQGKQNRFPNKNGYQAHHHMKKPGRAFAFSSAPQLVPTFSASSVVQGALPVIANVSLPSVVATRPRKCSMPSLPLHA